MRWQDVDLDGGWWTIPAGTSKNKDAHRVPLTSQMLHVLRRRELDRDNIYVFSNDPQSSVAWRAKKAASRLSRGLSFTFRAHDLRRTAASFMGEAGVDRFHIALVLNHRSVTHNTVTAIYDRYRYDKEKRAALQVWARVLEGIVTLHAGAPGKTVVSNTSARAPPHAATRPFRSDTSRANRHRLTKVSSGIYFLGF